MAQLWGGRFTKETDQLVYNFNASISFDQKFFHQDVRGSKAHVTMLAKHILMKKFLIKTDGCIKIVYKLIRLFRETASP